MMSAEIVMAMLLVSMLVVVWVVLQVVLVVVVVAVVELGADVTFHCSTNPIKNISINFPFLIKM